MNDKHIPYWRGAHRDWRVWVGVVMILAAMLIVVMRNIRIGQLPI